MEFFIGGNIFFFLGFREMKNGGRGVKPGGEKFANLDMRSHSSPLISPSLNSWPAASPRAVIY